MRVVITGAGGQLGRDLVDECRRAGDDVLSLTRVALDITDAPRTDELVVAAEPDVIFNCAAWTNVDACEDDPDLADQINGVAVGHLALAATRSGAHLVQVSTDYVFDGKKSSPYIETDPTNPQSAYGASKLIGEKAAAEVDATIVRTSWVCSAHGGNMVQTILRLAQTHDTLRFVSDQVGNPTFTTDLAPAIRRLGAARFNGPVHVTNAGAVSWFEFAQAVLHAAGEDPARVEPILTRELLPARPAKRPENSVLANEAYEGLGYPPLRDFRDPLSEVVSAYV